MERLTDRKTAADLRTNYAGLQAAGQPRDIGTERYIKLADYEDIEDMMKSMKAPPVKWQIIMIRYSMIEYIRELKKENAKLKDFIRMVLKDIETYLPEIKGGYTTYRGIDIEKLLGDPKEGE